MVITDIKQHKLQQNFNVSASLAMPSLQSRGVYRVQVEIEARRTLLAVVLAGHSFVCWCVARPLEAPVFAPFTSGRSKAQGPDKTQADQHV